MELNDFLLWFSQNLSLVDRFHLNDIEFELSFSGENWNAGYIHYEYDGSNFLDNLKGTGTNPIDAITEGYKNTVALVNDLKELSHKINVGKIVVGATYLVIQLDDKGSLCIESIKAQQEARGGGFLFTDERGYERIYRPHQYRLIFPTSLQG